MNILGIDPGSRNCGYCLLSLEFGSLKIMEAGLIKMKESVLKHQIIEFLEGFDLVIKDKKIDQVAIEDIFFAHNPKTVLKLAQFRGALLVKILQEIGDFYEYTPLQVKKALTGKAKASKEQVSFMVKKILNISGEIKPLDVTDAIAIAITHAQRVKFGAKH